MVTLAQSSPGDRPAGAPQSKTATVMLATSRRKISYALPESRIERSTENCKVERDWRLT